MKFNLFKQPALQNNILPDPFSQIRAITAHTAVESMHNIKSLDNDNKLMVARNSLIRKTTNTIATIYAKQAANEELGLFKRAKLHFKPKSTQDTKKAEALVKGLTKHAELLTDKQSAAILMNPELLNIVKDECVKYSKNSLENHLINGAKKVDENRVNSIIHNITRKSMIKNGAIFTLGTAFTFGTGAVLFGAIALHNLRKEAKSHIGSISYNKISNAYENSINSTTNHQWQPPQYTQAAPQYHYYA